MCVMNICNGHHMCHPTSDTSAFDDELYFLTALSQTLLSEQQTNFLSQQILLAKRVWKGEQQHKIHLSQQMNSNVQTIGKGKSLVLILPWDHLGQENTEHKLAGGQQNTRRTCASLLFNFFPEQSFFIIVKDRMLGQMKHLSDPLQLFLQYIKKVH